jgi:hypothetical protein
MTGRRLKTLRGVVEAPVEAVAEVLFDTGGRSPLIPAGTRGDRGLVDLNGGRITIEVDRHAGTVTTQGQWYRDVVRLSSTKDGQCLVTREIFNVAERLRWGVWFVARKPLAESEAAFAALLATLGERVQARGYPLP